MDSPVPVLPIADTDPRLADCLARLRASELRITQARIAIVKTLLHHGGPLSIEELHDAIGRICDLVTVYRSLAAMEDCGLVRRLYAKSGMTLHELSLEPERYHVITKEGRVLSPIETVPSPEMRLAVQAVEDSLRRLGYQHVAHLIQFFSSSEPAKGHLADREHSHNCSKL